MKISAKTGENVEEMFEELTKMILKRWNLDILT